jgi:hypothetical protein
VTATKSNNAMTAVSLVRFAREDLIWSPGKQEHLFLMLNSNPNGESKNVGEWTTQNSSE